MLPNKSTVKEFCELLKSGGAVKKTMKIFKKMPKG